MLDEFRYKRKLWTCDWVVKVQQAISLVDEADTFVEVASRLGVEREKLQYHCAKLVTTIEQGESIFDAFKREVHSGIIPPDEEITSAAPTCGSGYCRWCGKKIETSDKRAPIAVFCNADCSMSFKWSGDGMRPTWASWNEHFFDELTPDAAYILGFIIADGHIRDSISGRGSRRHVITLHQKEPVILKRLAEVLEFEGELTDSGSSSCIKLCLGSKHAWETLTGIYEVPPGKRKSYEVRIPKKVLESETCLPHFIRGLFDGDGLVGKKLSHIALYSGSEGLIEDFINVLIEKAALSPKEKRWEKGGYKKVDGTQSGSWYVRWSSVVDCMAFAKYIYGPDLEVYGSDLYLKRKRERLIRFFVPWRDREWLYERYVLEGKSLSAMAREAGVRSEDVSTWISKYNLNQERSQHWNLELGL